MFWRSVLWIQLKIKRNIHVPKVQDVEKNYEGFVSIAVIFSKFIAPKSVFEVVLRYLALKDPLRWPDIWSPRRSNVRASRSPALKKKIAEGEEDGWVRNQNFAIRILWMAANTNLECGCKRKFQLWNAYLRFWSRVKQIHSNASLGIFTNWGFHLDSQVEFSKLLFLRHEDLDILGLFF